MDRNSAIAFTSGSLCRGFLFIPACLLAGTIFLWLMSSNSSLRIASNKFDTQRNARTQRNLQFSGTPGVKGGSDYKCRLANSRPDPDLRYF